MQEEKFKAPKHSLLKNGVYALEGFIEITKNETSFKWQLLMLFIMGIVAWNLPISFAYASILFISLFIPILAEIANSSIERVVDLATDKYEILAKRAKDAGAALVLLSIIVTSMIWLSVLAIAFKIV